MRHLGIDYGTKKTGLALSDEAGTMGFPRAVVPTAAARAYILELIRTEGVAKIVMGESRDLAGGVNPVGADAKRFAKELAEATGLPLAYESELYTSAAARRAPEKAERSRSPKKRVDVDASAAALILTSYLSRHDHP